MAGSGDIAQPRWLKPVNKVTIALQRAGLRFGPVHLLTVPGRKSGDPRTTPVTPMKFDGARYLVGGFPGADWVRNARAAGEGTLSSGRRKERIRLVELSAEEARPVLRAFPAEVPAGAKIMRDAGVVTTIDADTFEALAGRCAVFRLDPVT